MRVGDQDHALVALPLGMIRYSLCRRLDGPQGRSVRVQNISPPTGIPPRTVQAVTSRYTDYAIPTHVNKNISLYDSFSIKPKHVPSYSKEEGFCLQ